MPSVRQITRLPEQDIVYLLKHARRIRKSPELDILIAPARFPYGRVVAITPGKIGNAPQRNLFRRQIKALFYEEKLYALGFDCVVIGKIQATTLSFNSLKTVFIQTLTKATL